MAVFRKANIVTLAFNEAFENVLQNVITSQGLIDIAVGVPSNCRKGTKLSAVKQEAAAPRSSLLRLWAPSGTVCSRDPRQIRAFAGARFSFYPPPAISQSLFNNIPFVLAGNHGLAQIASQICSFLIIGSYQGFGSI